MPCATAAGTVDPMTVVTRGAGPRRGSGTRHHPAPPPGRNAGRGPESAAKAVEGFTSKAKRPATRETYESHIRAWRCWCEQVGADPDRLDPELVQHHLVFCGTVFDDDGLPVYGEDGVLAEPELSTTTLATRLSALDDLAGRVGVAAPGKDPGVRKLMKGIRNLYGTGKPNRRDPILLGSLHRMVDACREPTYQQRRDLVVAALAVAAPRAGLRALTRIVWEDIELGEHDAHVGVTVRNETVWVTLRRSGGRDCPVAALAALRPDDGSGALLRARPDAGPLHHDSIAELVRVARAAPGAAATAELARRIVEPLPVALRDEALLLTEF